MPWHSSAQAARVVEMSENEGYDQRVDNGETKCQIVGDQADQIAHRFE